MNMPAHLFVSSDGAMYDTRRPNWSASPLRHHYADTSAPGTIGVRAAIRTGYAWPGGYALFGITSDGACLCTTCMRAEYRQVSWSIRNRVSDGWQVIGIDATCNYDEAPHCDHCSQPIGGAQ